MRRNSSSRRNGGYDNSGASVSLNSSGTGGLVRCAVAALLATACGVVLGATDTVTSVTVYSKATPGAVSPDLYRPDGPHGSFAPGMGPSVPGYAIVKQEREILLEQERSMVRFTDVPARIEPTTVTFESLTDPAGTRVLEQSFEFDLVDITKLFRRFVDQRITVEQAQGETVATFTGKLLSTSGGIVLQADDGAVQVVQGYSNIRFPELPGGLITRPTLVWDLVTRRPGRHNARVTYETAAMTWWADYNVVFAEGADANSGLLEISAWVSLLNLSGATYENARLKLVAGDVHRAPTEDRMAGKRRYAVMEAARGTVEGFEEKAFFEYHLYTLGRPTTLMDNATKQIELFPAARDVPCEKVLMYFGLSPRFRAFYGGPLTDRGFGTGSNKKVDIYLRFKNDKESGLGMPLPAGRVRVSKLDPADESLEFIGEDVIDHTPKDERILIKLGSAFDVVGERTQTDFSYDSRRNRIEETIEIKIRNHKDEPVKVIVSEALLRWAQWTITASTHDHEKIDSRTIHFPVQVEKDGEVKVRYTVVYTW